MERPRHPDSLRRVIQPPRSCLQKTSVPRLVEPVMTWEASIWASSGTQTARQRRKVKAMVDAIICCAARHLPQEDPVTCPSLNATGGAGRARGHARSGRGLSEALALVAEPWINKMRTSVDAAATTKKKKKKNDGPKLPPSAATIGILSFEVASAMSRAVSLYRSLSESEMARFRSQILASHGVRHLVSSDEHFLLSLALAEKLDDLNGVATVASRLGRRCSHPALLGFEHVYSDLLAGRIDPSSLGFLSKDMDGNIRKMERFVSSTAALYSELEVLTELEHAAKKFHQNPVHDASRRAVDQKIQWQRQDVKHLRGCSLWNQSYDKVVVLLARAICTIHSRISLVFWETICSSDCLVGDQSCQLSDQLIVSAHRPIHSGSLRSGSVNSTSGRIPKMTLDAEAGAGANLRMEGLRFHCGASPRRLFMECLSIGSSALSKESDEQFWSESSVGRPPAFGAVVSGRRWKFGRRSQLTMLAAPSTVGGSALALHYANIIIIIEKLLKYPHLVGDDARDDLYQMLPSTLRAALRRGLKSCVKNLAIYDAPLAHDWKEALDKILSWLSPMAHEMIRWQTDGNFEQQQIMSTANVLLLQTIYFADREKTEEIVCELLVGLNYICRYEQQQNALLDCASSLDLDECMPPWHMHYISS
ncbi:hypothetical protein B296_00045259 [Ensete ventricosum]|uniref:DUF668 domain-containing protein n=1 Tax=Ensete ventricosum TaxID=4639 RepID=A0A426XRP3_ENSVE|nr:hypothetical protein B296_00045259 [Ensete ventricosum]